MARVDVFYSLQSDYCYFLLDRLIDLSERGIDVAVRPLLGGVLRLPDRYNARDAVEGAYFELDTQRVADFLGLPYVYPDPSPIDFQPDTLWIAKPDQPRNMRLNRLYVGACDAGKGLSFLDHVGRMLWDGSTPGWDTGDHLARAMAAIGLDLDTVLSDTPEDKAKARLDANAAAILEAGHWGVPLMVYEGEPFYGQDRFDHLTWRLEQKGEL
jgi:2-hydroxychromene-2-carboxylate isomerase